MPLKSININTLIITSSKHARMRYHQCTNKLVHKTHTVSHKITINMSPLGPGGRYWENEDVPRLLVVGGQRLLLCLRAKDPRQSCETARLQWHYLYLERERDQQVKHMQFKMERNEKNAWDVTTKIKTIKAIGRRAKRGGNTNAFQTKTTLREVLQTTAMLLYLVILCYKYTAKIWAEDYVNRQM